jgi:hypothetical protein
MAKWDRWPEKIVTAEHTAQLCDYVVKKTDKRVMLVIAIGAQAVAVAKDQNLDPEAALAILEDTRQLVDDLIRSIHSQFDKTKREFGYTRRSGPS